ncbi:MAG: glycosyltransferase family 39 protein [Bryobacteraceae bacterium]
MRGHPHPALNSWILAGLLVIFGDVYEIPFHAAYIGFSLIAAVCMWSLAKRFSPHPLWATLLFLSFPAFIVNGTSLEADLPFLAFWMAGIAFFVSGDMASVQSLCAGWVDSLPGDRSSSNSLGVLLAASAEVEIGLGG